MSLPIVPAVVPYVVPAALAEQTRRLTCTGRGDAEQTARWLVESYAPGFTGVLYVYQTAPWSGTWRVATPTQARGHMSVAGPMHFSDGKQVANRPACATCAAVPYWSRPDVATRYGTCKAKRCKVCKMYTRV